MNDWFRLIIDLPHSMYTVYPVPADVRCKIAKIVAVCVAVALFDLLALPKTLLKKGVQKSASLIKTLSKTVLETLVQNLITPILPAPAMFFRG